jgi:multidrug efflux system outer membrane protein
MLKMPFLSPVALAVLSALALSACGTMAPTYERPAAPVAAQFPDSNGQAAPSAADLPWQDFFAEPRLRTLIELALRNNRDLRVAVLNIETARSQIDLRRADLFPTVGAGLAANSQPVNGKQVTTYTAGVQLSSYEVDLFGRVRSLRDAALAQYLGTEEARRATQISLIGSVASAELALRADAELFDLAERTLSTRLESQRLMQLRFDNGASSELDLRQTQSLVEQARVSREQQRRLLAQDRNLLTLLVGQPLPADLPPAPAWSQQALRDLPAGLPSEVLLRRPDVRQAEDTLISANANIGAARAAFYPRISLTGSFGFASTALGSLFENTAWTFAPQLLQPIFDGGRNRANLRNAEVSRDIAVAQYEKAIQSAFREVADALAGQATLAEQLRAQQAQTDAEGVRYRLSELRFNNGVASSLELLDAQRALFATQQSTVQAQLALLQNRVTTYKVLGGGWSEDKLAQAAPPAP